MDLHGGEQVSSAIWHQHLEHPSGAQLSNVARITTIQIRKILLVMLKQSLSPWENAYNKITQIRILKLTCEENYCS